VLSTTTCSASTPIRSPTNPDQSMAYWMDLGKNRSRTILMGVDEGVQVRPGPETRIPSRPHRWPSCVVGISRRPQGELGTDGRGLLVTDGRGSGPPPGPAQICACTTPFVAQMNELALRSWPATVPSAIPGPIGSPCPKA